MILGTLLDPKINEGNVPDCMISLQGIKIMGGPKMVLGRIMTFKVLQFAINSFYNIILARNKESNNGEFNNKFDPHSEK